MICHQTDGPVSGRAYNRVLTVYLFYSYSKWSRQCESPCWSRLLFRLDRVSSSLSIQINRTKVCIVQAKMTFLFLNLLRPILYFTQLGKVA